MRILVRYLLWLLIAALPLQGGAVAFMSCDIGVGHTRSTSHLANVSGSEAHAESHHEHCDGGGLDHGGSPHGKCSHCASCCMGAAVPPTFASKILQVTFSTFASVAVEPAMTAYIPATLERPPRRYS